MQSSAEFQTDTDMAVASQGCGPAPYCRPNPEQTNLYHVVQQHLQTRRALAGEDDWDGQRVPVYVKRGVRFVGHCARPQPQP